MSEYRRGLTELNELLESVAAAIAYQKHLLRLRETTARDLRRLREDCLTLGESASRRAAEIERLQQLSLSGLWNRLRGSGEERLEAERKALRSARLEWLAQQAAVIAVEERLGSVDAKLDELGDQESLLRELLELKGEWVHRHDHPAALELLALAERHGRASALLQELHEAITAGEIARQLLTEAQRSLDGASEWSTIAQFVPSHLLTTLVATSKLDPAQAMLALAHDALLELQRQCKDVNIILESNFEAFSFTDFSYGFDRRIHVSVQSRITRSERIVLQSLAAIDKVLALLEQRREAALAEEQRLALTRRRILESL